MKKILLTTLLLINSFAASATYVCNDVVHHQQLSNTNQNNFQKRLEIFSNFVEDSGKNGVIWAEGIWWSTAPPTAQLTLFPNVKTLDKLYFGGPVYDKFFDLTDQVNAEYQSQPPANVHVFFKYKDCFIPE